MPAQKKETTSKDESLEKFLEMEGIWSEDAEGEEYYQMMKHRRGTEMRILNYSYLAK